MGHKSDLTAEFARQLLDYDSNTGLFTWKRRPREMFKSNRAFSVWNAQYANTPAGNVNGQGYVRICITVNGPVSYPAHRLAFLLMTGAWPENEIDHCNRDQSDNRWENLRSATSSENKYNKGIQKNNRTGIKNVDLHQGKYRVRVKLKRKVIYYESFECPAIASIAAQLAQIRIAGDFAHHAVVGG